LRVAVGKGNNEKEDEEAGMHKDMLTVG